MRFYPLVLLAFLASACGVTQTQVQPKVERRVADPAGVLAEELQWRKTVSFGSRAGHFYGMDSDTELSFLSDGKVVLLEMGCTDTTYQGSYTVEDRGVISLQMEKRYGDWPSMVMTRKGIDLYLRTEDGYDDIIWGQRAGGASSWDMKPFWPFKMALSGMFVFDAGTRKRDDEPLRFQEVEALDPPERFRKTVEFFKGMDCEQHVAETMREVERRWNEAQREARDW